MADGTWSIAEAKAKLSTLVEQAQIEPQHLTRNGRETAVVVSATEYERLVSEGRAPKRTLADVLLDPGTQGLLTEAEIETLFARDPDSARPPIEF